MNTQKNPTKALRAFAQKQTAVLTIASIVMLGWPNVSFTASSWSPTLLVNTESFQEIDRGDSTTDIDLRFGSSASTLTLLTTGNFRFNKSLSVAGGLSGSYLTVDHQANISGALTVKGDTAIDGSTFKVDATNNVVGINIANPNTSRQLTIGSASTPSARFQYSSNTSYYTDMIFNVGGANYFMIDARKSGGFADISLNPSGGNVGVGTTLPKATFDTVGTISGSHLTVSHNASVSGSLVVKNNAAIAGNLSGSSFFGAGLGDCNNSTTSKLIYNATTGKFSCATDQTGGSTGGGLSYGDASGIFVKKSGDTMTGALTIHTVTTQTTTGALNVVQQTNATGAYIKSTTSKEPALAIDIVGTSNAPHLLFGYQGVFDTNLYRSAANILKTDDSFYAVGTLSGSKLRVSGSADIHGALTASGSIRTDGDLTINDDAGAVDSVLTFGNASGNQTIKFLNSSQKFEFSKDLRVVGNISGSTLKVDGTATVQDLVANDTVSAKGDLVLNSDASTNDATLTFGDPLGGGFPAGTLVYSDASLDFTFNAPVNTINDLTINSDATAADAILTFGNATTNQTLKYLHSSQKFQFSANLNVMGSISGKTLAVSGASSFSGASLFRTSVTAKGSFSGATFFGAGLGDCNNSTTSKLIYNPATGRFSCATDQTGGSTGGGMSYTDIHNIFVDQAGDTMTGALNIRPAAGSTTVGLNVAATMSGRALNIWGTGASRQALITANPLSDSVGIGTDTPYTGAGLTVSGGILLQRQGDPNTPPTDTLALYTKNIAGRMLTKVMGPSGIDYALQPSLFQNSIASFFPASGTTAGNVFGWAFTSAGTVSHPALASTNMLTQMRRTRWASATTANAVGGIFNSITVCWRGNAAGLGGFFFFARFGQNVNTNGARAFVGLSASTTHMVAAEPSAAVNIVGVGYNAADSSAGNWQLMYNDGTGTATKVDLGSAAARDTTSIFDLFLFAPPNGSYVGVRVVNISTNTVVYEAQLTTDLPTSTTFLRAHAGGGPAATGVAQNFELNRLYLETDQ